MIANKIKPKIQRVISKFPTTVSIYRDLVNEFKEPDGKDLVCEITGFYHEGNAQINFSIADKGEIKKSNQKFLMVVYDELSCSIQEGDYFFLGDKKYIVKEKGNQNLLNIYFDMLLEVI